MLYNWQQKDWPRFIYNLENVEEDLFRFAEKTGQMTGILKALPDNIQVETLIDIMVAEAIKTSEIEGEFLSRKDVMSSIRNNLGLNKRPEPVPDKKANGISKLMIDVRNSFNEELNKRKLLSWHKMLMQGNKGVNAGVWRKHKNPMQVVSGAIGKIKVHFEAPPSARVPKEMDGFIKWFNETAPGKENEIKKAPVRAAIAHLYYESIHPFEDGNGRIGRAIAEKALSQGIGRPVMLSLSKSIESDKKGYYDNLGKSQQSNEISNWINYFIRTILKAQSDAEEQIEFTLKKVKFFDRFKNQFNDRQLKVIKQMLDQGPNKFEGVISSGKYISLTKTSKATATRDLQDLLEKGAIKYFGEGGGRSTKYEVNL